MEYLCVRFSGTREFDRVAGVETAVLRPEWVNNSPERRPKL